MKTSLSDRDQLKEFIVKKDHPCLMSQSILKSGNYELKSYGELGSLQAAKQLLADLGQYLGEYDFNTNDFFSFIAVFDSPLQMEEIQFEQLLWKHLQLVHECDPEAWDETVSSDPKDSTFSFSILGHAFYVVGMHPESSRAARSAPKPTLVFNLHWQFEQLRKMGSYSRIRTSIRNRDLKKNGSINPMLVDFGHKSEAQQYSGRAVEANWECPFKHK